MADVSEESSDWLFDYVLSFFSSPAWEVPVMTFIDENCMVFDTEEENKFIYSDLHEQFRELVEGLLNQHLAEIGISVEDFAAICHKASSASREKEDEGAVKEEVLEQLLCMDDFVSFKKLMVRRNVELDLETARALKRKEDNKEEEEKEEEDPSKQFVAVLRERADRLDSCEAQAGEIPDDVDPEELAKEDQELRTAMEASLREMELLQLQEEMYHRELEQAIALSLTLEEEKLRKVKLEAKHAGDEPAEEVRAPNRSEEKEGAREHLSKKGEEGEGSRSSTSRLSPLKTSLRGGKRLDPSALIGEIEEKKKVADEALKRNQQALTQQKTMQEQLKSELSESEIAARAKYLKQQRDALVKKKKEEREKKLQQYQEETKAKDEEVPSEIKKLAAESSLAAEDKSSEAEEKRLALRIALARRLKTELLESSRTRTQFDDLDDKIQRVERLREENLQAQEEAARMIQKHQQLRNKNMMIALKAGLAD